MALTETYVDPSIAGNSGSGTIGDPYGDLQYALDTMTRDGTNGDRVNVKAGTAEVLASALTLATYGSPTPTAPLVIQGYTIAAGDGGIGAIDGNGSVSVYATNTNYLVLVDMDLGNCGANTVYSNTALSWLVGCVVHGTTGIGLNIGGNTYVIGCHVYDCSQRAASGGVFESCYIAGTFSSAALYAPVAVFDTILSVGGSAVAIHLPTRLVDRCSILSTAGTGAGINAQLGVIQNTLIEGYSGVGGSAIVNVSGPFVVKNCGFYNNTTNISGAYVDGGGNASLGSTPFAKSGSDTFANRADYFAPLDVGNVWGGAYPTALGLDKGAVQHAAAAASGIVVSYPHLGGRGSW